jgi:hypothetical protein
LFSPGLPTTAALLVALSFAACDAGEEREDRYAVQCGSAGNRIDTRQLLDLREEEAVEVGRRHGCTVRVEVRDGRTVVSDDRGYKTIGVAIRDGYVIGLCFISHQSDGKCSPIRD